MNGREFVFDVLADLICIIAVAYFAHGVLTADVTSWLFAVDLAFGVFWISRTITRAVRS